jgi:anti-anti-sigma factor
MSKPSYCHLLSRVDRGVLVLTVTEPHLKADTLAEALREELLAATAHFAATRVVLDLQYVGSLTSSGLRPLVGLHRHLRKQRARLALCGLSPDVAAVFAKTRLISTSDSSPRLFAVYPDVNAAVTAVLAAPPT